MSTLSSEGRNQDVGRRLSLLRASTGLSQNAFADRVGISPRAYQNYERGEREIPALLLASLFDAFSVDPMWVLSGPGDVPLPAAFRPDTALVEDVVLAVEQWLNRRRKTLSPEKKACLVRLLYEHFLSTGEVQKEYLDGMLMVAA